jgi:hypothetical protein
MSRKGKKKEEEQAEHPVPLALNAFEAILQACRTLAQTETLNELEGQKLLSFTESVLDLHDEFADRVLVEALDNNRSLGRIDALDNGDDLELTATRARIRERTLRDTARTDQPEVQDLAFRLAKPEELPEC